MRQQKLRKRGGGRGWVWEEGEGWRSGCGEGGWG